MGKHTAISWTDHTWSPWIGCTEVSPGCDRCYARALDARRLLGGATHWGARVPRYRTKNWDAPRQFDRAAAKAGKRRSVFPSMCDPFDNEVPAEWRLDFWDLVLGTPNLVWLLLTKRIGNAFAMLPWGRDAKCPVPEHVWIGVSVVNQHEADRDIPKLFATPAAKRFISYEPALGPLDMARWLDITYAGQHDYQPVNAGARRLDWIIVGGESSQGGTKARPFHLPWARSMIKQCRAADVPCFVKQLGSTVWTRNDEEWDNWPYLDLGAIEHDVRGYAADYQGAACKIRLRNWAGADPSEWPPDLQVRQVPRR